MDCFREFIIGRRFAPTRWLAMTEKLPLRQPPNMGQMASDPDRPQR
jgi:hypothetical protein